MTGKKEEETYLILFINQESKESEGIYIYFYGDNSLSSKMTLIKKCNLETKCIRWQWTVLYKDKKTKQSHLTKTNFSEKLSDK